MKKLCSRAGPGMDYLDRNNVKKFQIDITTANGIGASSDGKTRGFHRRL